MHEHAVYGVHSNSYSAWIEMGEPQNPSEEQLRILKRASMLKMVEETTVDNTDGKCAFTIPLAAHSVCLVELIPIEM